MKTIDNIVVTLRGGDVNCMCAAFSMGGARYHVWFDTRTMQLTAPILYKNPPEGTAYRTPGYFDTRRLNATSAKNSALIAEVLQTVVEQKMVQAAIAKVQLEEVQDLRNDHVLAVVREYWVAAMRGDSFPDSPKAISDKEFAIASARLADRLSR